MADSQINITVEGMTSHCENRIRQALERINGIDRVTVYTENKKVFIEYDDEKIDEQLIRETIEDEGYKVK
ncbi:MAG: heavy-metal-associated domain-containing protein [Thermoclostridium sp.]|nr:heavy-metal-associated domain-containing protein [Thermoclostridium sp.]